MIAFISRKEHKVYFEEMLQAKNITLQNCVSLQHVKLWFLKELIVTFLNELLMFLLFIGPEKRF